MIRTLVYILLWLLLVGVAIFATQNTAIVTVKFLIFQSINMPLGLVLLFSAGLGSVFVTIMQVSQSRQSLSNSPNRVPFRSRDLSPPKSPKKPARKSQSDDFDDDWSDDWD